LSTGLVPWRCDTLPSQLHSKWQARGSGGTPQALPAREATRPLATPHPPVLPPLSSRSSFIQTRTGYTERPCCPGAAAGLGWDRWPAALGSSWRLLDTGNSRVVFFCKWGFFPPSATGEPRAESKAPTPNVCWCTPASPLPPPATHRVITQAHCTQREARPGLCLRLRLRARLPVTGEVRCAVHSHWQDSDGPSAVYTIVSPVPAGNTGRGNGTSGSRWSRTTGTIKPEGRLTLLTALSSPPTPPPMP
jgi:hypothetical protein